MLLLISSIVLFTNAIVTDTQFLTSQWLRQGSTTISTQNTTDSTTKKCDSVNTESSSIVCGMCWDGSIPEKIGCNCAACPEMTLDNSCQLGKSLCITAAGIWSDSLCACQFGEKKPQPTPTNTTNTTQTNP